METKLSDNTEAWQQEITSEMFRQLPYLSDYSVNVMLDKVDQDKGFAFGKANVGNIQESPEKGQDPRNIAVPLIVKERMLKPFDILMSEGKSQPLSEERLRKHLFKSQPFELTSRKPTDKSMVDKLQPPTRSHLNANVSSGGFGKFAQTQSLLSRIAPTISEKDATKFIDKLASSVELKTALLKNQAFKKCAQIIARTKNPGVEKTASYIDSSIKPTVVQFVKLGGGKFKIKWASADAFAPQENVVPGATAQNMVGPAAAAMKPGDALTATTNSASPVNAAETPAPITAAGQYKCQDESGNPVIGSVYPVIDYDMQPVSLFLFTDSIIYALQERISGTNVGPCAPPQSAEPMGYGTFINIEEPGNEHCTLPVTITSSASSPDGHLEYYAETDMGEPLIISLLEEIEEITPIDGGHIGIPATYSFVPLGEEVALLADASHFTKVADIRNFSTIVEIRRTGNDEYSLSGAPLNKLANDQRTFLSKHDTEFLLATMGAGPRDIYEKLAHVDKFNYIKIAGLRTITPLSDLKNQAVKIAAKLLATVPWQLRRDLTKEAAAIPDEQTVDNVLSMGFLNQDNIHMFADYLPQLEDTGGKLAGLLLASRMGLSPVPEDALVSAMRNTDQVVTGLKELQQKVLSEE